MSEEHLYYFDALPVHPLFEPFESLTSYLTRLAQANKIVTPRDLIRVINRGKTASQAYSLTDYSFPDLGAVSTASNCSEKILKAGTLYHLGVKLDRSSPRLLRNFLHNSISSALRYCPHCLQEHASPYYSLKWRFLSLSGCAKHHCKFLDCCEHCGSQISFFTSPLRIAFCPACGNDLRSCSTTQLSPDDWQKISDCDQDIEFLLTPHSCETMDDIAEIVGRRFAYIREGKNLTMREVANQMQVNIKVIMAIEEAKVLYISKFHQYMKYSKCLNVNLRELFQEEMPQSFPKDITEEVKEKVDLLMFLTNFKFD